MTAWLLTWLCQGLALTLAVAFLLKTRRTNAATRHLAWWAALLALIWLGYASSPQRNPAHLAPAAHADSTRDTTEPWLHVSAAPPLAISVFLGVWVAIALAGMVRLLPSVGAVFALRDRCRPFPAHLESELPLWLEAKDCGRRAELVICDEVAGATVLGFHRPCIALPSSLVAALDPAELDQVILHEHAHVVRRDDWAKLAQALVQAALWVNPAVAYIGRMLNREREMACDERVVARTGLPQAYARCLTRAAEMNGRINGRPVLASALVGGRRELVRRVDGLLAIEGRTRGHASVPGVAGAACAIVLLSVQLNAVPLVGVYVEVGMFTNPSRQASADMPLTHVAAAGPTNPPSPVRRVGVAGQAPSRLQRSGVAVPVDPPLHLQFSRAASPPTPQPDETPGLLSSRSFEGAYPSRDVASRASGTRDGWRAVATPGIEIANGAKKTGLGLAGAFTRVGVSLGRRFQ